MRVLLTGASGFTGLHLGEHLERLGMDVLRATNQALPGRPGWVGMDLEDTASIKAAVDSADFDAVIHLAALSFVGHADAAEFYRVNVIGTLNLLEALAETGRSFHRVILASSANVYGRSAQEVNPETICPAPVNHYGCSKLAMEHLAMGFRDRLPLMAVRPFNYTGRGQDANFLVPKIVEHFRQRNDSIELGNIDVRREFNDVRMVCEVYGRLLQADGPSPIVNLCSGLSHRLTDVLELMQEIAGYEIDVQVNPAFVRANELPDLRGDPARLTECIGSLPRYSLRDTLQWMYEA